MSQRRTNGQQLTRAAAMISWEKNLKSRLTPGFSITGEIRLSGYKTCLCHNGTFTGHDFLYGNVYVSTTVLLLPGGGDNKRPKITFVVQGKSGC